MQNKALRFATRDENTTYTTEQLHINTNTQPINIKLHNRGQNTKSKLINTLQDETYIQLTTNNEKTNQHNWFRKPYSIFPNLHLNLNTHNLPLTYQLHKEENGIESVAFLSWCMLIYVFLFFLSSFFFFCFSLLRSNCVSFRDTFCKKRKEKGCPSEYI